METARRKFETSLMDSKYLMAWLMVALLWTPLFAAPKRIPHSRKASNGEPFRSFRMLDDKLTLLAHQQEALNAAFNPLQVGSQSEAANSGGRTMASRNMKSTAAGIVLIAGELERLYQRRHEPFGGQMFRALRIRAEEVQRGVSAVAKAQTRSAAESAANSLDKGIVSLVVQFQAASGGYGAARCSPGAWTCCEPKRSKDLLQSEQVACMWGCVKMAQTCTGFLGPRIRRP
ncbi:MAG: hypothetical protein JWO91_296 [Acidobacteriaceae bacterium]|nr:hypothetical protein [Acidobacteriaceae bacterium]